MKKLFAVLLSLVMVAGVLPAAAFAIGAGHQDHCVCGGTASIDGHTHNANVTWVGVSDLSEITKSGYYYLKNDVECAESFQPVSGVVLCLNGKTVTSKADSVYDRGSAMIVNADTTFTLTDCGDNAGKITHETGKTGRGLLNRGTVIMYGGSVCGNTMKSAGAGVCNSEAATFYMYGGSIADNHTTEYSHGGGVYNRGTFTMTGGSITGNEATGSGGGMYNYRGTVTLSGTAAIRNNSTDPENRSASGGGVDNYLGMLIMTGGEISGNTSNCGGGVSNAAASGSSAETTSSSFTMTGGTIFGNEASAVGGGIFNSADKEATATFTMSGKAVVRDNQAKNGGGICISGGGATMTLSESAEIKDNTATSTDLTAADGGGVYFSGSSYSGYPVFHQNGGTITGNTARRGGGIYVNYGKWNATSGSITGNTADYGGGVHMSGSDTITLGGAVTVTGNKTATDSKNNNLYLVLSTFRVAAADLTDGAKIGVTAPLGATYPIILTDSAVTRNYFVSDDAAYETVIDETGYVVLRVKTEQTYTVKIHLPTDGSASSTATSGALEQTVKAGSNDYQLVSLQADSTHYFSNEDIKTIDAMLDGTGLYVATVSESANIKITGTPTEDVEITVVTTAKEQQSAPNRLVGEAPSEEGGKGYITGTSGDMEYRKLGTEQWTDCSHLYYQEVDAGYTYEVRYKASLKKLESPISRVTVPVYIAVVKVSDPTPHSYIYDGQEHTGIALGADYVVASGTNTATEAGSYVVHIQPADGKQWEDGTTTAKEFGWSIAKADQDAPAGLAGVKPTVAGASDGTITGVTSAMEYRQAGAAAWTSCTGTTITGLAAGSYEVRYKETANYNAGKAFAVTVPNGDAPVYVLTVLGGTGSGSYESQTTVTITANAPAAGKVFDKWVIRNGDAAIADTGSATTTVTTKAVSATIEATYKDSDPAYRIIEGADSTWTPKDDGTLTFRANGDVTKLTGIKVDGVTVPADQYTVGADLTMVTLKNEYLAALTAGKHTLTVVYSDGECSANFEIQADASHTHQYGTEWKYDETNHWHECSCGDTADKAAHTFVWKVDQAATAEATGLQHEECSVCGAKRNENSVIEKLTDDNSGSTDNTGAADATDQTGSADSTDHTGAADTTGNQGDAASPSTGEHSSLLLWITLLLISGGVLTGVRYARRCATR